MPIVQVGQLELVEKEATPEKPKQMGNREKMRRKEENWEVLFIISITKIKIDFLHWNTCVRRSFVLFH